LTTPSRPLAWQHLAAPVSKNGGMPTHGGEMAEGAAMHGGEMTEGAARASNLGFGEFSIKEPLLRRNVLRFR
jgi:hypothetical protein